MLTIKQLAAIMPHSSIANRERFIAPLNAAMAEFDINTPARVASFLAQIAHESGSLKYVREIASGIAYEGRKDLGNVHYGDGKRFRGRGLIQITGRANYLECGKGLNLDLIAHPELLEQPVNACRSATWFWNVHGCNELADVGLFETITRKINGGFTHQKERMAFYDAAQRALTLA
ncbi:MAG: glycoside hydrolase family 19 protein [Methylobacter sp.]